MQHNMVGSPTECYNYDITRRHAWEIAMVSIRYLWHSIRSNRYDSKVQWSCLRGAKLRWFIDVTLTPKCDGLSTLHWRQSVMVYQRYTDAKVRWSINVTLTPKCDGLSTLHWRQSVMVYQHYTDAKVWWSINITLTPKCDGLSTLHWRQSVMVYQHYTDAKVRWSLNTL
jgi:hypothetical protein